MKRTTVVKVPTNRYSLENSVALWRKTTVNRWYTVAEKGQPPTHGWKGSMEEAVKTHRRGTKARS